MKLLPRTTLMMLLLAAFAGTAFADHSHEHVAECDHPCEGYRYEAHYDVRTGEIKATLAYEPSPHGKGFQDVPGLAIIDFTNYPDVAAIMFDPAGHRVDPATSRVESKPGGDPIRSPMPVPSVAPSVSGAGPMPSPGVLTAGLALASVAWIWRQRRRARPR